MYYKQRRKKFGQNFILSRRLINRLLGLTLFDQNDLIVEIGPGTGAFTFPLAKLSKQVLAVEIDPKLCCYLNSKMKRNAGVRVINLDFLKFGLPQVPYKVIGNIPFNLQSDIIRKLFSDPKRAPIDCYLVIEKKYYQSLRRRKDIALDVKILHYFKRSDFTPATKSQAVFVRIRKK